MAKTSAPAPSGLRTKSVQCEALVRSKYAGVDWTARTPYANNKEAIQPIVRQARAQERYTASSTNSFTIVTQVLPAPSHVAHTFHTDTEYNQRHGDTIQY